MSDIRSRIDKLEKEAPPVPDNTEAPPIVIYWPEDETPETRAAYWAAVRWHREHGGLPSEVVVDWSEGVGVVQS